MLQNSDVSQNVLVRTLALTESDVKEGAGLFSNYDRDVNETLTCFEKLCENPNTKWNLKDLHSFCRTRRLGYCDNKGKQLPVGKLLLRIRTQLTIESRLGRPNFIHCPRKSQLPSRKRRLALVKSGVLNIHNARRLVNVKSPDKDDNRWRCTNKHMINTSYTI